MLRTRSGAGLPPAAAVHSLRLRPGTLALAGGIAAVTAALGIYAANLLTHPWWDILSWLDLRLYRDAGQIAWHHQAVLYSWQLQPDMMYTYPPFAALLFAGGGHVPWLVAGWLLTGASVLALAVTLWLTFGALGWAGQRRLAATLLLTALTFWSEPVQRVLHWGQVDLLLMMLVVWDLCGSDQRRWKGAGIGLAAGIKLVPLIFLPYLLLAGRARQAVTGLAAFLATAAVGWLILPTASAQWWLHGDFLHATRTGFLGFVANQSLLGMFTRQTGTVAAASPLWLVTAVVVGTAGIAAAARWHRRGLPVHGWVTCAITGLLVSPVSWDHHWVWIAPLLAVLADAAVRAGHAARYASWARAAGWAAAALIAAGFGAWPTRWPPPATVPWGLIWAAPHTVSGIDHPWDAEYQWHVLQWFTGNLYLLAGAACLACLALFAPSPARAYPWSRGIPASGR